MIIIMPALMFVSCARAEYPENSAWLMGTPVSVRCPDETAARAALDIIREVETQVNIFEEGINAAGYFPCSPYVEVSMSAAQRVYELSSGAFNIAVYTAMQAWGLEENNAQIRD